MGFFDTLFKKPYRVVDPAEAKEAVERGAVLLDVREPHEWKSGHAPKARHIPLGQLGSRVGELPRNREILVVCRSGARSARAAKLLSAQRGDVANVKGGMGAWARQGLPVVAKGGGPGRVA
ncbi:rhodanese-like domain-containing protein [Nocardioides pakistanensis]